MLENPFQKRSIAEETLSHDFSSRLSSGETITSATLAAKVYKTGVADNSVLRDTAGAVSSGVVSFTVEAGTNGIDYEIIISAVTSLNQTLTAGLMLRVRD